MKRILTVFLSIAITNFLFSQSRVSLTDNKWQQGGLFFGKTPQQEILAARSAYTKKFDIGNGKIELFFGGPFHYSDRNGNWQDIDLTIKETQNEEYSFNNTENLFSSGFASQAKDGVQLEQNGNKIKVGINTKIFSENWILAQSGTKSTTASFNNIRYNNIFENTDLSYQLTTNSVQHYLYFKNRNSFANLPAGNSNVFVEETIEIPEGAIMEDDLGTVNSNRKINGNIKVIVKSETLFTIWGSCIWDATFSGNPEEQRQLPEQPVNFKNIETEIQFLTSGKFRLMASIPSSWLLDPQRIYPIVFDPTVGIGNQTGFNASYRYPFNTCRQQRVSQILFLKSDINAGGTTTTGAITDIAFFQNSAAPVSNNNVQIKMQEVSWTEMTTPTLTSSGFSTVYGPSTQNFTSGSNQWRTLSLSSPFSFTNTKNLLIEARFANTSSTPGCTCDNTGPGGYWGWYNAPYPGHRWAYSNSAATPPSGASCEYNNSPERNPAYGFFIPATKITINTTSGCVPVSFTTQPQAQAVVAPATAQFSVTASGSAPTYQWEMSTNGGTTWSNVPATAPYSGVTSNQLTINPTNASMNGYRFRCKGSNTCTSPSPVVSGQGILTVNASGCTTVLSPPASASIPATGGTGSFTINVTPNTCSWSASENQSWLTITSALNGTGDATLNYTVSANTGTPRTGIITVNGQSYTVNQLGAAAPTTYTISGRVVENGSTGLPSVAISTTPVQGPPVLTDAQGYYTLNVPLTYIGTVRATLSPYTFSPLTHSVSSSNFSNKNFDALGVSINILPSSSIYPWQREGENIIATINVSMGTTTTDWRLKADVYDANNVLTSVPFPPTTALTYTINTSLTNPVQNQTFKNLCKNGSRVEYIAIYNPNPSITDTIRSTNIIEQQWIKKDTVYYNTKNTPNPDFDKIRIPVPFLSFQSQQVDKVEIIRITKTWYGIFSAGSVKNLESSPNSSIFPVSNGYCVLRASTSNIEDVFPGEFQYKMYAGNALIESGLFNLTKVGRISQSPNNNKVVVFVGGIWNDLEGSFKNIDSYFSSASGTNSDLGFSLAAYLANNNFNVWYIAQSNGNYTQRNAYSIKIGLERIYSEISPLPFIEINLVTHSKGGLDSRGMLTDMACSYRNHANTDIPPSFLECFQTPQFSNSSILPNGTLKKVVFMATPHNGANWLAYVANLNPLMNQPALKELQKASAYPIINNLNNFGEIPVNIKLANVTAYSSQGSFTIFPLWATYYDNQFRDGPVNGKSSDCISNHSSIPVSERISIKDVLNNTVNVIQMYQNHPGELGLIANANSNPNMPHLKIHTNKTLSTVTSLIHSTLNCTETTYNPNSLVKIFNFLNNASGPNTVFTCGRPSMSSFYVLSSGSILSGANLYRKLMTDSSYSPIGITKENGEFFGNIIPDLQIGDSIRIDAPGYEVLDLPVNSEILTQKKVNVSMLKTLSPTTKIKYPSLKLVNQNQITANNSILFETTGQNVLNYQINYPFNQTNVFVPLTLSNNFFRAQLDTGYNFILVRFIGQQDTVILGKEVYYLPDTLMRDFSFDCSAMVPNIFSNCKVFVNNVFYKNMLGSTSIKLLTGVNEIKFSKYGYRDTVFVVDTVTTINLSMQPYSYSSLSDSIVLNFNNRPNPQYWKTITVKNLLAFSNVQLSAKQYDNAFIGMSLKPQTRKFAFRRIGSASEAAYYKTAIALDQINTPDKDSVYLLSIKGNRYIKYLPNDPGITEYDPEVQKLEFDKLDFTSNSTHDIVLMQKQAPQMKPLDTLWHSGQTLAFPISMFVSDPDSIKNDLTATSSDVKVVVDGNIVYVTAPVNFVGTTSYTLTGIHDWLSRTRTYTMKVIPPEVFVPSGFTPNNDGKNDILAPVFMGKILYCHLSVFNRYGQKVFETKDCLAGWNGRIGGVEQATGTYVYYLTYKFEGIKEEERSVKGIFTLIR